MEFSALEAFVTVAERGSFSRAAEALHLTQPAVSKRVAALEDELHARLFDRIGRKVNLTEAGVALLANARRILQELEESRRVIANLSTEVRGRLSLATSHHAGLHRLPPVLRTYTKQYAQVELDLHFMDSESACSAVEHGDLELAVVTLPADPSNKLKLTKLWNDPLDVVAAKEHPLASKRRLSLAELAKYPAILPALGTFTREIIAHAISPWDSKLHVTLETNYLETIKMMVSIGLGWSALPRSMIGDDLRALNVSGLRLMRHLGAVQHRDRTLSNAARAFYSVLRKTARDS